jgi:hypothetical protein
MIIAYIAHPVGGDVKGNIDKILKIVRQINLEEPDVVPFVPYLADILAMDDANPTERSRGIKNDTHVLEFGGVNQIRLYGDRISPGMRAELNLAKSLGIEVWCSEHLKAEL